MGKLRSKKKIDSIVLHCAATSNGAWFTAEDIDDWHKQKGFKRNVTSNVSEHLEYIGYHFVIEITGQVVKGRALNKTGAHVRGHNAKSIGICLIGNDAYTLRQWQSLKSLLNGLQTRFKDADILGHRQLDNGKTCPGFDVPEFLLNDKNPMEEHLCLG